MGVKCSGNQLNCVRIKPSECQSDLVDNVILKLRKSDFEATGNVMTKR